MNERLEKEIDKRFEQAKVVGYMDGYGPVEISKEPFTRIARHFYNLALEEVKKELNQLRKESSPALMDFYDVLDYLGDYIDEQSK